jgi:protein transport protein SEC24
MYLWIGAGVESSVIQNLFGVDSQQLQIEKCQLLELDTPISESVRSVIKQINEQKRTHMRLVIVRQRDTLEMFFKNLLVEDKGCMMNASSYVDFLYQLHREIKSILS